MRYEISGTTMQTVSIDLDRGEKLYSQTHQMAWMSDSIRMDTHTGGGILAGLARALSGGSLFVTEFTADAPGHVAFAPRFPGQIIAVNLQPQQSLICRKETFLCAEMSVQLEIAFQQRFGAGLFAGEGFILQKVTGPGTVFLDLSGEVVEKTLLPGERLLVHAGHIGMQEPSVQTSIQMLRGFRNVLFGGEGLFLATLTGPGKIWLQSMPILNLAEEIARHLPGDREARGAGIGAGIGGLAGGSAAGAAIGGILGSILGASDS
ncbi:MAG: TIGR00266 family protein [Sphingomonas sp.]